MKAITASITIARTPDEVFAYSADLEHRMEWQPTLQAVAAEDTEPLHVGSRVRETRRVTGGPRSYSWELSAYDRPHSWAFRGTDGPVRPVGTMRFNPIDGGSQTQVDFEIDFRGRGAGTILALLARRDARKQIPRELAQLRARLEPSRAPALT
jgi:uncharacterized protein YndB with AHSA1/START domain